MLGESLRVPFRADDWIGTILVGSVLTLLSGLLVLGWLVVMAVLVSMAMQADRIAVAVLAPLGGIVVGLLLFLPSLVLRGYLIGVVRSGIRGEPTVESFVGWGSLVGDGTRSTLLSAIYLVPAAVLLGLAVGGAVATAVEPEGFEGALQAIAALLILVGGFGLLFYALVYLYLRPAARAVFASTGAVRAALDVRRVGRLSASADYITGWLIGMGILVVGPTLLLPLFLISLAVAVVSPPLAFIGVLSTVLLGIGTVFLCRVSAAHATGQGSAEGLTELYPDAVVEPTDKKPEPTVSLLETTPSEVSAAVQTGRTVQATDTQSSPADSEPIPVVSEIPVEPEAGDLSGVPVYPRHVDNGSALLADDDPTDTDSAADTEPSDDSAVDTAAAQSVDDSAADTDPADGSEADTDTDPADDSSIDGEQPVEDEDEFVWGPTEE